MRRHEKIKPHLVEQYQNQYINIKFASIAAINSYNQWYGMPEGTYFSNRFEPKSFEETSKRYFALMSKAKYHERILHSLKRNSKDIFREVGNYGSNKK